MTTTGQGEQPKQKKPYKAPRLVRLGSVRELTAGATGSKTEAIGVKSGGRT